MTQDPNYQPTSPEDRRTVPEAERPAPGPHAAGEGAGSFPRDEALEGQTSGAAPAREPEWNRGATSTYSEDDVPEGSGHGGGAPQAVDPGLSDQAPGGPAERPAWGQGAGASYPNDEAGVGAGTDGRAAPGMQADGSGSTTMTDRGAAGQTSPGTMEEPSLERFRERWPSVQGAFVDDPRNAVAEADRLIAEVIQGVEQRLTRRREHIQGQWMAGEPDTEQLRQTLHGYRALFHRLLENEL